jgi:ADP-heptose:LPS heptosyltransferase
MRLTSQLQNTRPAEIKVIAAGGLGDCLLLTPFIRYFKQTAGYQRIVVVTHEKAKQIFEGNPHIDRIAICRESEIFFLGLPEQGCDIFSPYFDIVSGLDQNGELRIGVERKQDLNLHDLPALEQIAELHAIPLQDKTLEIVCSEQDRQWAGSLLSSLPQKPTILLASQSPLREKEYPLELWQKVTDRLAEDFNLLHLGSVDLQGVRALSPVPAIGQSAALFSLVQCIIGIDSFPMHLAHAVGTPAVVLWGPTNANAYGYPGHIHLRAPGCPPCANTPRLRACSERSCLKEIEPESVVDAVQALVAPSGTNEQRIH